MKSPVSLALEYVLTTGERGCGVEVGGCIRVGGGRTQGRVGQVARWMIPAAPTVRCRVLTQLTLACQPACRWQQATVVGLEAAAAGGGHGGVGEGVVHAVVRAVRVRSRLRGQRVPPRVLRRKRRRHAVEAGRRHVGVGGGVEAAEVGVHRRRRLVVAVPERQRKVSRRHRSRVV